MPEAAQTFHGWATPQHTTSPVLLQRIVVSEQLAAPVASIFLSEIEPYYTHLSLRIVGVSDTTSGNFTNVQAQFNDDSASNKYGYGDLHYAGGLAGGETLNATFVVLGQVPTRTGSNITTRPGVITATIFEYSSTFWQKYLVSQNYAQSQDSSSFAQPYSRGGTWKDLAAIEKITLTLGAGSWVTGTTVTLYGEP